jgi:hypothetical protein
MNEDNGTSQYSRKRLLPLPKLEDPKSIYRFTSFLQGNSLNEFPPLQPTENNPSNHQDFLNRFQRRHPAFPLGNRQDPYHLETIPPTIKLLEVPEQELPALLYFLGYLGLLVVIIIIFFVTAAYLIR